MIKVKITEEQYELITILVIGKIKEILGWQCSLNTSMRSEERAILEHTLRTIKESKEVV